MTIADQGDVEALLLRPLSALEAQYIGELLRRADANILGELPGYKFDGVVTGHTETLRGSGAFDLWLPGRPILDVTSIIVDGDTLDPAGYEWFPFGDVHRVTGPGKWPRSSTIDVTWDYGLEAPPADIVNIAADMVRWAITNPTGVRQESVGQYSVAYMVERLGDATASVSSDHVRTLNRYRYPVTI